MTTQEICIDATKNYTFTIYDNNNDAIEYPGYYAIRYGGTAKRSVGGLKPSPTLCFSGNNGVHLPHKGWVGISNVKIGDNVLVPQANTTKFPRSVIAILQNRHALCRSIRTIPTRRLKFLLII